MSKLFDPNFDRLGARRVGMTGVLPFPLARLTVTCQPSGLTYSERPSAMASIEGLRIHACSTRQGLECSTVIANGRKLPHVYRAAKWCWPLDVLNIIKGEGLYDRTCNVGNGAL